MEKFRVNGISAHGGNSKEAKIALKQLKREARKKAFHQRKENEAKLDITNWANGAENNFGFRKSITSRLSIPTKQAMEMILN